MPSTSVPRKTFDPTVLATSTPVCFLDPALNATSFSGRVVAMLRSVRPMVDWERPMRTASVVVLDERRYPETERNKVALTSRRRWYHVGFRVGQGGGRAFSNGCEVSRGVRSLA